MNKKVILELIKVQLATAYLPMINMFNRKSKKNKISPPVIHTKRISLNGAQIGAIIFMAYLFVNLCFFMGVISFGFLLSIDNKDVIWAFMSFVYTISILFSVVGSVFAAKAYMFDAKDNELLFSMPIKTKSILISRLLTLYLLDGVFSIVILIPSGIVYAIVIGFTIPSFIFYLLTVILLPTCATAISALLGYVFGYIASKITKMKAVTAILGFAAFAAYFVFITNLTYVMDYVGDNILSIGKFLKVYFPPAYLFGDAVVNSNLLNMLYSILIFTIPSLLVFYLISKNFKKIATAKPQVKYAKYVEKPMKVQNTFISLVKKELSKLVSSSTYIFNCTSGSFFAILLAVFLIIKGGEFKVNLIEEAPQMLKFLPIIVSGVCAFFCAFNYVSAVSISIEAHTLWILKVSPISNMKVLLAKAFTNTVISSIVLIVPIITAIIFNISIIDTILIIISTVLASFMMGLFGILINLAFPKFDWVNEAIALKQGASVFISLFGGLAIVNIPATVGAIVLFLTNSVIGLLVSMVTTIMFIVIELLILKFKGVKTFENLEGK